MNLYRIVDWKGIVTRYTKHMADAEICQPIQRISHDRRSHQASNEDHLVSLMMVLTWSNESVRCRIVVDAIDQGWLWYALLPISSQLKRSISRAYS
jgi:hypothetical protein